MLISASFTSIINVLLIIADSIICGQMLSDTAVAAIDLITPLYTFCMFIAMLLSLGIPILYSRAMGRSQKDEADLVFGTGLTVTIIGGILIFFFLTIFRDAYFSQYELSNELYLLAKDYYFWIRFEILVMPLAEVMVESVFADGDESCTLLVSIVETSTNVMLSVILCRTMGIAGVALASFVAVSLRLLISLIHFLKKSNSLRLHLSFSLAVLKQDIRLALTDSGNYLSLAVFSYALNSFVLWLFGPDMLIMAAVIVIVQEFELLFDGVGEAVTPILSVYFSEKCYTGVRKIWRLAVRTAIIEGLVVTVLLVSLSGLIPGLLGITDPTIYQVATYGIMLMAIGMAFVSYLYLLTSYHRVLDKILLSFVISVLRDAICTFACAFCFGMLFGIYGVFAGISAGAALTQGLATLYIRIRYGKKNPPLLIADLERGTKNDLFDLIIRPESVTDTRDAVEQVLRRENIEPGIILRVMLVLEELLMLIYEKNEGKTVSCECAVILSSETLTVILWDNGEEIDLTEKEMEISSLRCYFTSGILHRWTNAGKHQTTMSFNRNCLEIPLRSSETHCLPYRKMVREDLDYIKETLV